MAPTAPPRHILRLAVAIVMVFAAVVMVAGPAIAQTAYYGRSGPVGQDVQTEEFGAVANSAPRFDGTEVVVAVGQSLQAAVDGNPAGTHFRIAAGIHRNQQVVPKNGNIFTGEAGAKMSGARVLAAGRFVQQNGHWVLNGQTDETTLHGTMVEGQERDAAIQDLWLDSTLADHVNSRGEVDAPGEWFYDYDRDQIVMFDAPGDFAQLELSSTPHAFTGTAADVVIEHLTITRYAQRAQQGAIHGDEARGWTIRNNTVTQSHGVNIRVGAGFHVTNNRIMEAGQLGIGGLDNWAGYQAQLVVEDNEIADNGTLGYDWRWEAGATKFVLTTGMLFQNNWVHHNNGPGPWFDIDNVNAVIRSNLVEYNTIVGIFYEISYGAEIYDNISRYNGADAIGDLGAGIYVSSSKDVEIHHNALYGNRSEILATQGDRGVGAHGLYEVTNLNIHDNDMALGEVSPGVRVEHGDADYYYNNAGNTFSNNTYRINESELNFWAGVHVNLAGWKTMGHDTTATVLPAGTTPTLSPSSTPFAPAPYGAVS